jgi:hypothetical protein
MRDSELLQRGLPEWRESFLDYEGISPCAAEMIQYEASGYPAPHAMPKATRKAMIAWLGERRAILASFGKFFERDNPWHPYQQCISQAQTEIWKLKRDLEKLFEEPKT